MKVGEEVAVSFVGHENDGAYVAEACCCALILHLSLQEIEIRKINLNLIKFGGKKGESQSVSPSEENQLQSKNID